MASRGNGHAAWPRKVKASAGVMYDLGCGGFKQPGAVGVDIRPGPSVDIVCNLFRFPWKPIPTASAHTVVMHHLWEHIPPELKIGFLDEVWRICQDGAKVYLSGPYGWSNRLAQDPTHQGPAIVEGTFTYFDPRSFNWDYYQPKPWAYLSFCRVPMALDTDFNVVLQKMPLKAIPALKLFQESGRLYGPLVDAKAKVGKRR